MHELWRRIVFSILISNTNDHLRNHGFLWAGPAGWRLSPAYDLNPVPIDIKPRVLSTAIDLDDGTASLDLALSVAAYFGWLLARRARSLRKLGGPLPRGEEKRSESASRHRKSTASPRPSSMRISERRGNLLARARRRGRTYTDKRREGT
jgi:hypothetical protein